MEKMKICLISEFSEKYSAQEEEILRFKASNAVLGINMNVVSMELRGLKKSASISNKSKIKQSLSDGCVSARETIHKYRLDESENEQNDSFLSDPNTMPISRIEVASEYTNGSCDNNIAISNQEDNNEASQI